MWKRKSKKYFFIQKKRQIEQSILCKPTENIHNLMNEFMKGEWITTTERKKNTILLLKLCLFFSSLSIFLILFWATKRRGLDVRRRCIYSARGSHKKLTERREKVLSLFVFIKKNYIYFFISYYCITFNSAVFAFHNERFGYFLYVCSVYDKCEYNVYGLDMGNAGKSEEEERVFIHAMICIYFFVIVVYFGCYFYVQRSLSLSFFILL